MKVPKDMKYNNATEFCNFVTHHHQHIKRKENKQKKNQKWRYLFYRHPVSCMNGLTVAVTNHP